MDTILKICSGVKYKGPLGKQLLIDAFKDSIPQMIWNRPKMGSLFHLKNGWVMISMPLIKMAETWLILIAVQIR
jgi:hypothetical protein